MRKEIKVNGKVRYLEIEIELTAILSDNEEIKFADDIEAMLEQELNDIDDANLEMNKEDFDGKEYMTYFIAKDEEQTTFSVWYTVKIIA